MFHKNYETAHAAIHKTNLQILRRRCEIVSGERRGRGISTPPYFLFNFYHDSECLRYFDITHTEILLEPASRK